VADDAARLGKNGSHLREGRNDWARRLQGRVETSLRKELVGPMWVRWVGREMSREKND
jgi:hypothetical protein